MSEQIEDLVTRGVSQGFAIAASKRCGGSPTPKDQCPMRPEDGCACLWAHWRAMPWWQRWAHEEPSLPSSYASISLCIDAAIEREISDIRRRARSAGIPVKEVG